MKVQRPMGSWAAVALGGNQPFASLDGPQLLQKALEALEAQGLGVLSCSSAWRTPAWPDPSEPAYTNAAAVLAADGLAPEEVLAHLLAVEQRFGRERRTRWAARTLDLDLLDMDGRMLASPELTLPHPRLCERAFVLAPLAEAAPWWRHPGDGRSAAQMLQLLSPGGQQWLGALR